MNKSLLSLALVASAFFSRAQSKLIELKSPMIVLIDGSVYVFGMDESNTVFHAYKYDKTLTQTKEYSYTCPATSKFSLANVTYTSQEMNVMLGCRGKCPDYYLKLNTKDLKEINTEVCPGEERDAYYSELRNNDKIALRIAYNSPYMTGPSERFIGDDWVVIGNENNSLKSEQYVGFAPKPGERPYVKRSKPIKSRFDQQYEMLWKTELDVDFLGMTEFIAADESNIIVIGTQNVDNKIGRTYLFCLDAVKGKIKQTIEVGPASDMQALFYANGYFDAEKNKVVVFGNVMEPGKKKNDGAMATRIGVYSVDLASKSISTQELALPDLSSFDYKPIDFTRQLFIPKNIIKNKRGEVIVTAEIRASGRRIGLSNFKIDGSGKPTSNGTWLYNIKEIAPMETIGTNNLYRATSSDGRNSIVSTEYKGKHYTRLITFDGSANMKEISITKMNEDTDEKILDDSSVLIMSKATKGATQFSVIKY